MEESNQTSIADFTLSLLDIWGSDVAAGVLGTTPGELEQIAHGHDFNDRYLNVPAALGLKPEELGTEKAYLTINDHLLRSVLKDHHVKSGSKRRFHKLLARDRIMTREELERRLVQAGVNHQPALGGV